MSDTRRDDVLAALEHVKDPRIKITRMLQLDLVDDVGQMIEQWVAEGKPISFSGNADTNKLVAALEPTHRPYSDCDRDDHEECRHPDTESIPPSEGGPLVSPKVVHLVLQETGHFGDKGQHRVVRIDLLGIARLAGWDDARLEALVRQVLEQMIAIDVYSYWEGLAVISVVEHFLGAAKEDDLARRCWVWLYTQFLKDRETLSIPRRLHCSSRPLPGFDQHGHCASDYNLRCVQIKNYLDCIIDQLLELGMPMEEVKEIFHKRLARKQSWDVLQLLSIAGAKCWDHSNHEQRAVLLAERFMEQWDSLIRVRHSSPGPIWFLAEFYALVNLGMQPKQDDMFSFEGEIAILFSKGCVDYALQVAWLFRTELGQESSTRGGWQEFGGGERQRKVFNQYIMEQILPRAFKLASEEGRLGVAAALALRFGMDACQPSEGDDEGLTTLGELVQTALTIDPASIRLQSWSMGHTSQILELVPVCNMRSHGWARGGEHR